MVDANVPRILGCRMKSLFSSLVYLAQLQNEPLSSFALSEVFNFTSADDKPLNVLKKIASLLHLPSPKLVIRPDRSITPALIHRNDGGGCCWGVLKGVDYKECWIVDWFDSTGGKVEESFTDMSGKRVYKIKLSVALKSGLSPALNLIRNEFFANKSSVFEIALGGLVINVVALAVSLYSMHVYDRVVPTGSLATLQVLTIGVLLGIFFEFLARAARARVTDKVADKIDKRLARNVYLNFLSVRLDQLPPSIGGMAAKMRCYEVVRNFISSALNYLMVDVFFILIFLFVIFALAGAVVLVPLSCFLFMGLIGFFYLRKVEILAGQTNQASTRKMGMLVEAIEGAETIKSGQGGWRMLGNWMNATDEARSYDLAMRSINERSSHLSSVFQQLSYVLVVAIGALLVGNATITVGSLIACSILSGRVLAPAAAIPGLLIQWGHSAAALKSIDELFMLESDHSGSNFPIVLDRVYGSFDFKQVETSYNGLIALRIPSLSIRAGEKIGLLGPVGAGKTTLLRLLSGMYKPSRGQILLDGVDLSQISKPVLAEHLGYLQQEGRLFAGTLRENLVLGLIDPGDSVILEAADKSGLLHSVIQNHPLGLQLPIFEGGRGMSGGQRQLVNLTRVLLRKPNIWLLDEPTASMDQHLEMKVRLILQREIKPNDTLVLTTHKPEMLTMVDRIIVVLNHQIVMDGPAKKVMEQLSRQRAEQKSNVSVPSGIQESFSGDLS